MWSRSARPVPAQARTPLLTLEQVVNFEHSHAHATTWEREVIARRGLRTVPVEEVAHTPDASAEAALARLLEVVLLLIHFDVDVIDSTDSPLSENTGHNEGLMLDQAMADLCVFTAPPAFAALTITEPNPLHGEADGATLERFMPRLVEVLRFVGM